MLLKENEIIVLKSPDEIEKIRKSSLIVAEILAAVRVAVRPGITTIELERLCEEDLNKRKVRPAFKGYRGYPYCLCTSVNEEVVHGMPSKRVLREGDILGLDFGIEHKGYYGDVAITIPIGKATDEAKKLIKVAEIALERAIEAARVGNRLSDISYAVFCLKKKNEL